MKHRTMAIIFLIIILLIMPYYSGLKECVENPNYESSIADITTYKELLANYINILKTSNQALKNSTGDDYSSQFDSLFKMVIPTS